ncbi:trihelix transcription factor GT-2 [Malania oleifera]|uniref:trihelix transcription factor GT-2 n=1 Tax=Malania oleifera TaxID=397392 RepID=UPI0025AE50A5|nr:trihelix transcription factor GT-2 [Malania oleifera]XP_057970936.1 trihelix transcription factor GT-2 [Malania oleifera]
MELFAADDFPDEIAPFPEPADLLYDHPPVATVHSSEINRRAQLPPQKLRPIRCNGKAPAEYSESPVSLSGSLLNCQSMDLGFLAYDKLSPIDGEPFECSDSLTSEQPNSGGVGGNGYLSGEVPAVPSQVKVEVNAEDVNLNPEELLFEKESGSSSDDGSDSLEDITKRVNQKRKRKTRKKLEHFVENLMMKVIEKQELMHKQLIEMIETRERERRLREESWMQQEMERAKRDEEIRAQERSRSLALISFIQKTLGHEIQIPESLETSQAEEVSKGEIDSQKGFKFDPSNRRWPKSEVQALITLRTALDEKFRGPGAKGPFWEEISAGLLSMGYCRSAKKCREKWENINKYFRRSITSGKKHIENVKTQPYFNELDILYKNGLINSENASKSTNSDRGKE